MPIRVMCRDCGGVADELAAKGGRAAVRCKPCMRERRCRLARERYARRTHA